MPRFSNPSNQSAASSSIPFHTRKRGHGSGRKKRKNKKNPPEAVQQEQQQSKSSSGSSGDDSMAAFLDDDDKESRHYGNNTRTSYIGEDIIKWKQNQESNAPKDNVIPSTKTVTTTTAKTSYAPKKVIIKEKGKINTALSSPEKNKSSRSSVAPLLSNHGTIDDDLSSSTILPPSWISNHTNNRALAIDTRTLQTFTGDAASKAFLKQVVSLLGVLSKHGATPKIIASSSTTASSTSTTKTGRGISPRRQRRIKNSSASPSSRDIIDTKAIVLEDDPMLVNVLTSSFLGRASKQDGDPSNNDVNTNLLDPVPIRAPLNIANSKNRKAVHVPKSLLAYDSWKLFGDLVDTIVDTNKRRNATTQTTKIQEEKNQYPHPNRRPLDITILTNDVALFTDTNNQSHTYGLEEFWKRMESKFYTDNNNDSIRSIDIIVVETGVDAMQQNNNNQDDTEKKKSGPSQVAAAGVGSSSSQDSNGSRSASSPSCTDSLWGESNNSTQTHVICVAQCIREVKSQLLILSERKRYSSTSSTTNNNPIRIQLTTMENNAIDYQKLFRNWLVHAMSSSSEGSGNIQFDLPETMDGTQCSVSLDASYKLMPFRLNSISTGGLFTDMKLLSRSKFQVVQLVPVTSIDASLLFGVPMSIQAALTSDLPSYREMQLLVRCLFSYFVEKDLALLLRSVSTDNDTHEVDPLNSTEPPLYHMEGQTFILMTEELPNYRQQNHDSTTIQQQNDLTRFSGMTLSEKCQHWKPSNGVLYRYATSEQILLDRPCCAANTTQVGGNDYDEDTETQYTEYIGSSLDFLDRHPLLNPIYVGAKEADVRTSSMQQQMDNNNNTLLEDVGAEKKMSSNKNKNNSEPEWTDDCGVGARESPCSSQSSREGSTQENADETDSNTHNNMLDDFYYT